MGKLVGMDGVPISESTPQPVTVDTLRTGFNRMSQEYQLIAPPVTMVPPSETMLRLMVQNRINEASMWEHMIQQNSQVIDTMMTHIVDKTRDCTECPAHGLSRMTGCEEVPCKIRNSPECHNQLWLYFEAVTIERIEKENEDARTDSTRD